MAYVALDMRTPEKCVLANYPQDAILDVHYEVLGKSSSVRERVSVCILVMPWRYAMLICAKDPHAIFWWAEM